MMLRQQFATIITIIDNSNAIITMITSIFRYYTTITSYGTIIIIAARRRRLNLDQHQRRSTQRPGQDATLM